MGSRSDFLALTAAAAGIAVASATAASGAGETPLASHVSELLDAIPGKTGAYLYAAGGAPIYRRNEEFPFVVGSCFKTFVATVVHQMAERGEATLDQMIPIDESVYVPGSTAFTPKLHGEVPVRVALQEMIAYSDNTATDMLMKLAGVGRIRLFLASAGLASVKIPDSIRALFSYAGGLPEGQLATYRQLYALDPVPEYSPRPATNDVQTSKCSMRELASYYERAMRGDFFTEAKTLADFRVTMSTGSGLAELAIPHGSAAYMKGGSVDGPASAIAIGGQMCTGSHSVYFAIASNWDAGAGKTFAQVEEIFLAKHKAILDLVRGETQR